MHTVLSTPAGDVAETNAIKRAMGSHCEQTSSEFNQIYDGGIYWALRVVSKRFLVFSAIRDQILPPTINIDNQDPACDLDYVANTARDAKINVAMSNSFGFGGTNGTLIFKKI